MPSALSVTYLDCGRSKVNWGRSPHSPVGGERPGEGERECEGGKATALGRREARGSWAKASGPTGLCGRAGEDAGGGARACLGEGASTTGRSAGVRRS